MKLSSEVVENTAHLARLAIAKEDIPRYKQELEKILSFVEKMNTLNTEGIVPLAHSQDNATQPLREDVVSEPCPRETLQTLTHQVEAGLYLVPKVIEGGGA